MNVSTDKSDWCDFCSCDQIFDDDKFTSDDCKMQCLQHEADTIEKEQNAGKERLKWNQHATNENATIFFGEASYVPPLRQ